MSKQTLRDFAQKNGLNLGWDAKTGNVTIGNQSYTKDSLQKLGGSLVNNKWELSTDALNSFLPTQTITSPVTMSSSDVSTGSKSFEQIMNDIQNTNKQLMEQLANASKDAYAQVNNAFAEFNRKQELEKQKLEEINKNKQAYLQSEKQQQQLTGFGSQIKSAEIKNPIKWDGSTNSIDASKVNLPNNTQDSNAISRYLAKDIWANK